MRFETFVASRYLKSPRKDRSISVITKISITGVALGVAALIVVLSVMNGFERDLRGALRGANPHLTVYSMMSEGITGPESKTLEAKIREAIQVEEVAPFTTSQALIMGRNKPMGSLIKGIDAQKEPQITRMNFFVRTELFEVQRQRDQTPEEKKAEEERAQKSLDLLAPHYEMVARPNGKLRRTKVSGIIIGSQLAKNLGVTINDWVTVISPEERITPMGNMPRAKKFKVVGFFESGIMGYDEILSFVDLKSAQKVFGLKDKITGLSISLADGDMAEEYKKDLQKSVKFPFTITSWIEQNKNLFAVIQLEKLGLAVILTLIIIIAAFNIISSLVMLVIEKSKDIAILKSIGATNSSIRKIFMYQGSIIGLTGTVIGEILGITLCWIISEYDVVDIPSGVYIGNRIPMYIEPWQLVMIALISFMICFIVTIFPSLKASKLNPVEGLRNE
ncbi:MAG: lipoprotein-releasing system transmembrane subunit LolC [SAR324 cluster bacterium]|uniref:Lipoprotein-releasing system transmembrane subunit LolC n=1 Tax=SAR324 cluster bacterium TaxID=2024889 RepID=A0A2A4TB13_9DELT|nr:MAG: lipoprotein-releasing system transmembrane subunit LolC [SAR324 cluster bacterium]